MHSSLRTYQGEVRYALAKKNGLSGDIKDLVGVKHGGLRLIPNEFEYDAFHDKSNMLLGGRSYWLWWWRLGRIYKKNQHAGHDQLLLNFRHSQSQPHIWHAHLLRFKNRKDFKL